MVGIDRNRWSRSIGKGGRHQPEYAASKTKAAEAKPAVKAPAKMGAKKLTATDQVLKIVKASKKGVDIITIKEKTGFEDKKLRNIIFRANKEGKIKREDRGVYIGVK